MEQVLSLDSVKSFFSEFLEQYKLEIEKNYSGQRNNLTLFNCLPVKMDLMFDREMRYGVVILTKSQGFTQFSIDNTFQDPIMVIAMANTKIYQYSEQGNFLYIFQLNAKRFSSWQISSFVKDFINYELAKNNIKGI